MNSVRMQKGEVVAKIRENRDRHAQEVVEAKELYHTAFMKELARLTSAAETGKYEYSVNVVEPVDHVDQYDQVLEMLAMEVSDQVTLTAAEFNNYIRDKWSWRDHATVSNSFYKLS